MSEAATLCRAAALIRERAQAATPGPWFVYNREPWAGNEQVALDYDAGRMSDVEFDQAGPPASLFLGDAVHEADSAHIATFASPPVALAVADWLEKCADVWDQIEWQNSVDPGNDGKTRVMPRPDEVAAVRVARLYLNEGEPDDR